MLSLDSPKWSTLRHAYGDASDIPNLLRQLECLPSSEGGQEPWGSIWGSLAHQGDVYTASFAAVPHIVSFLASAPARADFSFFQFPAWVEICRRKLDVAIPPDLAPAYWTALAKLPALIGKAAESDWDEAKLSGALAALAVAKGFPSVGEAVLELNSNVANEFLEWRSNL